MTLNIAGFQAYIHRSIKDAVWVEKNMSTISLHKDILEGVLEFHVCKFDIDLSWCVVVWNELPNKCTCSEHFFKRIFWNITFSIFRSSIRFIEALLRVLQLRTFPSLQTWLRVSKVLSNCFFFFYKLDFFFFTNPARDRCFNTFTANSAPFY